MLDGLVHQKFRYALSGFDGSRDPSRGFCRSHIQAAIAQLMTEASAAVSACNSHPSRGRAPRRARVATSCSGTVTRFMARPTSLRNTVRAASSIARVGVSTVRVPFRRPAGHYRSTTVRSPFMNTLCSST